VRRGALVGGALALAGCASDALDSADGGGGTIAVLVSGEALGTDGIPFPPAGEVALRDGWNIRFEHVLATIGEVSLAEDPDTSPTDASRVGSVVARARGPWAVDLRKAGTEPGAGGEGTATPLVVVTGQTERGGRPFEYERRYAFGFDLVPASESALRVNFTGDEETERAYQEMIEAGYTLYLVGKATFRGSSCETSDPTYDRSQFPTEVPFRFGFKAPVRYTNCQNQENQGDAFDDEAFQRGVAVKRNAAARAQITLHLDHPFYSDVQHEPALYFDPIAAQLVGRPEGTGATLELLKGVDPSAFTDAPGTPLPWNVCDGVALPPGKQMSFDTGSVPLSPSSSPADALRDYYDYIHYVTSTLGHLNGGEGLCFVQRNYPSPR
jgi:hypothetical protein